MQPTSMGMIKMKDGKMTRIVYGVPPPQTSHTVGLPMATVPRSSQIASEWRHAIDFWKLSKLPTCEMKPVCIYYMSSYR